VKAVEYFLLPLQLRMKLVASEFASASSFFKVLLLPQKFNRLRFHIPAPIPMFYEKCFRFRLLKKSNASEFASAFNFFFQSAFASAKILPLPASASTFLLCVI